MSYKLGIGLLAQGNGFNDIRNIQLSVAEAIGTQNGLTQPPHVTVVRPFVVKTLSDVRKICSLISSVSDEFHAQAIKFSNFAYFGTETIYLQPDDTKLFEVVRLRLAEAVPKNVKSIQNNIDTREHIFHSTITYKLSRQKFNEGILCIKSNNIVLPVEAMISELALFMQVDEQWVVIQTAPLHK